MVTTSAHSHRFATMAKLAVATGAFAAGAMFLTAPAALATPVNPAPKPIPEKTIKSECAQAPDGIYSTSTSKDGKTRTSDCSYTSGSEYCADHYINGVFQSSVCGRVAQPTTPGQRPPVANPGMSGQ